jgi:putative spermidine/putrescine transport system substrate-binding protein
LVSAKDIKGDYWVAFDVECVCLVTSTSKYTSDTAPHSWADFWDTRKFPGRRALQNWVQTTPEKALLADGVDPANLYPLDLDRAFKVLDRIKPSIRIWWPIGNQVLSQELLRSGEVDMLDMWDGRALQVIKQGAKGKLEWNQGFYFLPPFSIPKGAKNIENAQRFINFILQPKQQAAWSNHSYYGYVNTKAGALVDPSITSDLPTAPQNFSKMIQVDAGWWATNLGAVQKRYDTWLAGA